MAGAQPDGVRRIGVLIGVAESDPETKAWVATFRKRLDELDWKVGGNLQIDERWTAGDPDRNREFAGELVAKKPNVIFAFSSVVVAALQRESRSVPIVFTAISDPVGSGFVEGLARPGGNATGGQFLVRASQVDIRARGAASPARSLSIPIHGA